MTTALRVLVCGGRDYTNKRKVFETLDKWHKSQTIYCIIHGAATGADRLAEDWAKANGIHYKSFPANWNAYGSSAGPMRNQEMLRVGRPDLVIAFPGGRGTANMKSLARAQGIHVVEPN
jgi:hypothetical protein